MPIRHSKWVPRIANALMMSSLLAYCINGAAETVQTAAAKETAQKHFASGERLFESGRYAEAATEFIRAYEILPHYTVLMNIGLAFERSGDYPSAIEYLQKYTTSLNSINKTDPEIESLLKEMQGQVSELEISAECINEGCHILVDGIDHGESTVRIIVLPGPHTLQVVSDGQSRVEKAMTISAGEKRAYVLTETTSPEPLSSSTPIATVPPTAKKRRNYRPFLWASIGVGVGAGIASGILWGTAFGTKSKFDDAVAMDAQHRLKDKGETLNTAAVVTTAIAGAAAVSVLVLGTIRLRTSGERQQTGGRESFSMEMSPGYAGISVAF